MDKKENGCPFLEMFSVISRKWSMLILATIGESESILNTAFVDLSLVSVDK